MACLIAAIACLWVGYACGLVTVNSGNLPQLLLLLISSHLIAVSIYRGASESGGPRCRKCGYILRGITEPRCPECGERI